MKTLDWLSRIRNRVAFYFQIMTNSCGLAVRRAEMEYNIVDQTEDLDFVNLIALQNLCEKSMALGVGSIVNIPNIAYDQLRKFIIKTHPKNEIPYIQYCEDHLVLMGVLVYPIRHFRNK